MLGVSWRSSLGLAHHLAQLHAAHVGAEAVRQQLRVEGRAQELAHRRQLRRVADEQQLVGFCAPPSGSRRPASNRLRRISWLYWLALRFERQMMVVFYVAEVAVGPAQAVLACRRPS